MAYDKIARQRERRAEQRAAKLALQARLQPSTASSFTRGDVYTAKGAELRPRNNQAENQFVVVQTVQPASLGDTLNATGPRQIGQYDPPTRWHRWNNSEHDIITELMEVAANQEQRIRVLADDSETSIFQARARRGVRSSWVRPFHVGYTRQAAKLTLRRQPNQPNSRRGVCPNFG